MKAIAKANSLKIIVCGEGGIGKTTLLTSFQTGHFNEVSMTLGLDPHIIRFKRETGADLALQIWDLGGQKHFFDMGVYKKYCQGAHGALVCFDLSELETLEKLPQWVALLPAEIPKILVGTKKDAGGDITPLVKSNLKRLGLSEVFDGYLETSTKYALLSVYEVFKVLLKQICSLQDEEAAHIIQDYTNLEAPQLVHSINEEIVSYSE